MTDSTPSLMEDSSVQINDILQLKILDDPNALPCHSRVDDVADDCLLIAWPFEGDVPVPFHLEQKISLSFVRGEAGYIFDATIKGITREPAPQLKVLPLGAPAKVERREFFRLKVNLDLELAGVIIEPGKPESVLFRRAHTYDLSAGGLALREENSIPVGTVLEAKVTLPDKLPPLKLMARVVSSTLVSGPDGKPISHIGVSFPGLKEPERQRIMRYLFQAQRSQLVAAKEPGDSKASFPKRPGRYRTRF